MSYLLETLGRGWLSRLSDAFQDRMKKVRKDAAPLLVELTRQEPDRADLQMELGFACLSAGKPDKARSAFLAAARRSRAFRRPGHDRSACR